MVTGTKAFNNASFIMFQKISNILSIASFVLIVSTLVSAFFGYKYVTSEQFKAKMMNEILGNVKGLMPDVLGDAFQKQLANQYLFL